MLDVDTPYEHSEEFFHAFRFGRTGAAFPRRTSAQMPFTFAVPSHVISREGQPSHIPLVRSATTAASQSIHAWPLKPPVSISVLTLSFQP